MIYGTNFEFLDDQCLGCIEGKGHNVKNEFCSMASPAKRSGERIHYDLFSFDVLDRDCCKYCLVIIDEFSGFLFVYFLRKKSELEKYLISFINMIEQHTTVLPSSVVRTPDFGLDKRVVRRVASVHADRIEKIV